jgi:hypothetical protein
MMKPEISIVHTRSAAASVGATLALVFLPKCPLCVAAYLTALGVSAGLASLAAPFVRPAAFLVASASLGALLIGLWRLRKRRQAPSCCAQAAAQGADSRVSGRARTARLSSSQCIDS